MRKPIIFIWCLQILMISTYSCSCHCNDKKVQQLDSIDSHYMGKAGYIFQDYRIDGMLYCFRIDTLTHTIVGHFKYSDSHWKNQQYRDSISKCQ